jgi:hypothetical protein
MSGYVEDAFKRSRELFGRTVEWLEGPEAAGLEHAVLEERLAAAGREAQRLQLQEHLDLRAAREQRRTDGAGCPERAPGG